MRNKPTRVSPSQAAKWLTKNKSNRPLSQVTVTRYATAMLNGEWKVNGDSIRFDENGDLIDGQHRLHACVKSGKTFETYVAYDLPTEAFDTIDQGRPRTMGDVLARRGEKHYSTLAAAIRYAWLILTNCVQNQVEKMRPPILDKMLDEHPGIRDSVQHACELSGGKCYIIPPSYVAALHYLFSRVKPNKNKEFWTRVIEGTDLTKDMPEYWLRKRLLENTRAQAKLPCEVVFAFCIKTWNASSQNKTFKFLKWIEGEEFPKIIGLNLTAPTSLKLASPAETEEKEKPVKKTA